MRYPDEITCDREDLRHHTLEWIVRIRPEQIVPVSLVSRGGRMHLTLHSDGLLSLDEFTRLSAPQDPMRWVADVLLAIRSIAEQSDEWLLSPDPFRLDADSVWFHPQPVGHVRPILTCFPVENTGVALEPGLRLIAVGLLSCLSSQPVGRSSLLSLHPLEDLLESPPSALFEWLDAQTGVMESASSSDPSLPLPSTLRAEPPQDRKGSVPRMLRRASFFAALALPVLLAAAPLLLRWNALPFSDGWSQSESTYRLIAFLSLVSMVLIDAVLLFLPASPLRLPPMKALRDFAVRLRKESAAFRYEVGQSGLPAVLFRRFSDVVKYENNTQPLSLHDGTERLGFLSEGEPGTPAETEGLRAYLLTSEFLVGRDPDVADLVVPDAGIGRVHARISRKEGTFFLTDLGSVNGTFLNHRRLDRHTETILPDQCEIRFAERRFHFTAD